MPILTDAEPSAGPPRSRRRWTRRTLLLAAGLLLALVALPGWRVFQPGGLVVGDLALLGIWEERRAAGPWLERRYLGTFTAGRHELGGHTYRGLIRGRQWRFSVGQRECLLAVFKLSRARRVASGDAGGG